MRSGDTWRRCKALLLLLAPIAGLVIPGLVIGTEDERKAAPELAPLPAVEAVDGRQAALGRFLFFDPRLSGDASLSCAECHAPEKGWADGLPLSQGYPGSLYLRNTPTVLNAVHKRFAYWDGRLAGADMATVVRDHIAEAHFMQADGRLVIERLRQVPAYEEGFRTAFGGEPSYGRILNAVVAYLKTLRSREVPLDRYLAGDRTALSPQARAGLALFQGKARCIECHYGALLSDGGFHNLGVPENPEIFRTPERHITFRRFFKVLGVSDYASLREDLGLFAITKMPADRGRFATPSLREVAHTAPYMHNGMLATLEEVVEFYDRGGGRIARPELRRLGLTAAEQKSLVEFLRALSGQPLVETAAPPQYELRKLGEN